MTTTTQTAQLQQSDARENNYISENDKLPVFQEVNKPETLAADAGGADDAKANTVIPGQKDIIHMPISNGDTTVKRNVTFPEDKSIILGYLDPPDPWKNVPKWTTKDLIASYKKSCQNYGIKPFNKLLQQLEVVTPNWNLCFRNKKWKFLRIREFYECHLLLALGKGLTHKEGVENNSKRCEMISLKGEKMDSKHAECLESIFRLVQFKTVELEASHLDDETSVAIFDMIEYYDSACNLNISFNKNIGIRGWQACSKLIRKAPNLSQLDARNCELNERVIPFIGRALKLGSHITSLHLENTYLSGRPLVFLVTALKMNELLKELFLADNRFMPSDGIQLGNLLKYNHKLQLLDLRNNHLQDVGAGHLAEGLTDQNTGGGLATLVLWNNQITFQALPSLGRALASTESLETLNLGHNSITNEGVHLFKDGLLKNHSLLRLGLQGTKITCEGAIALAEYVADSSVLIRLDLRENDIKTAGLMALSLALKVNSSVIRVDVDKDTKKDSAVKDYADQQKRLKEDIECYLERNRNTLRTRQEEEKKEIERKAQEDAARKMVEVTLQSAQENALDIKDITFIPTCNKIQRPKLLFSGSVSPEQSLDSPVCGGEIPVFSDSQTSLSATQGNKTCMFSSPPGELLLSPQYSESVNAKKIFTVSKVSESLNVNKGAAGQLSALSAITSPVSAGSLLVKQDLLPLNLNSLQQTSVESLVSPSASNSASLICNKLENETVNEFINQIINDAVDLHCKKGDNSVVAQSEQRTEKIEDSNCDTSDIKDNCVNRTSICDKTKSLLPSESSSPSLLFESSVTSDNALINQSVESAKQSIGGNKTLQEFSESAQVEQCESLLAVDDSVTFSTNGEINRSTEAIDLNSLVTSSDSNFIIASACKSDDSIVEELNSEVKVAVDGGDQWMKISQNDVGLFSNKQCSPPDFQTSLTVNGLTHEIASALDTLEVEHSNNVNIVSTDDLSSPDEFEKELDEMLANVKCNFNSNILTSLSKTPEEVLQEAMDENITCS